MKKTILILLAIVLLLPMQSTAKGYYDEYKKDYSQSSGNGSYDGGVIPPNDQAMLTLMWMVYSDLEMSSRALNQSYWNNVSAMGHLNNAQSALKRTNVNPSYAVLISEIHERISKIKFYLVMNEKNAVSERLGQLMSIIRYLTGGSGNLPINTGGYYQNNQGYNNPFNQGGTINYNPYQPTEVPISSTRPILLPSGTVPVR